MTDFGTQIILDKKLISSFAPNRPEDGHKYTFGRTLIVAGSKYMTGAQELCVTAALRSGVGLVQAFSEDDALFSTKINCPCALTCAYPEGEAELVKCAAGLLKKSDSVAIGPGMEVDAKSTKTLLLYFLANAKSLVIDASALTVLAKNRELMLPMLKARSEAGLKPAILTPHIGEFKRILHLDSKDDIKQDVLETMCVDFARENKCFVVLKSHETLICTPHKGQYKNYLGNSGMAKGGCGDVLTGLIAGLVAQGISEEIAVASAVYVHSFTGDVTAGVLGARAMLPTDMLEYLPEVFEGLGW